MLKKLELQHSATPASQLVIDLHENTQAMELSPIEKEIQAIDINTLSPLKSFEIIQALQ